MVERQARRMTNRLDVNRVGAVTIAEVEHKEERFALLDRNDDGKLEQSKLRHGRKSDERSGHKHHQHQKAEKGDTND